VVSARASARLPRTTHRARLFPALNCFVAAHRWRPQFALMNAPTWYARETMAARSDLDVAGVEFGGTYRIAGLKISRGSEGVRIDAWWEPVQGEEPDVSRYLFLHLVDDQGAIVLNRQIPLFPYGPLDGRLPLRHDGILFPDATLSERVKALAFGVYHPKEGPLMANKGDRTDWGGKRVLLALPAPSMENAREH